MSLERRFRPGSIVTVDNDPQHRELLAKLFELEEFGQDAES